jgi:hypothetical protein
MRLARVIPLVVLVGAGASMILTPPSRPGNGFPAFDIYSYFLVNALHAVRSLHENVGELFWNPYQNCGQPFFANPLTGLLYPPHLLFLVLNPDTALRAVTVVNLCIAGVGAYALTRELGAGRAAALAGGLAFQLGNTSLFMAAWSPMHGGPFAWLPMGLAMTERLLRRPDAARAIALGVVLTCALLPGFPLMMLFTCALIVLRVGWAVLAGESRRPGAVVLAAVTGLVLPVLLAAVQLLPAIDFAQLGIRGTSMARATGAVITLDGLRRALMQRSAGGNPFVVVPTLLAAIALLALPSRGRVVFYLVAALLFELLAFGFGASFYTHGPFASVLRDPGRFAWVVDIGIAVAAAFGVHGLATGSVGWATRTGYVIVPAVALLALDRAIPNGLTPREWILGAFVPLAALASTQTRLRNVVPVSLAGAVLVNAFVAPVGALQVPLASIDGLWAHASLFTRLRARLSPQDRVAFFQGNALVSEFRFMPKSATLYRIPTINDYEPQVSRHWARYFFAMRDGGEMTDLQQFRYVAATWQGGRINRRLFDLTAARFLVVDAEREALVGTMGAPIPERLFADEALRVYENPSAAPRAAFIPRLAVVPDEGALLQRLAQGDDDLQTVALVEAPPASGFLGDPGDVTDARIVFLHDDPTRIVLRAEAPRRGFLLLADQNYPGWRATVNDEVVPILRANVVFRLVEVPAGRSTVEFRYRTPGLVPGAALSLATLAAVLAVLRRRQRAVDAERG